MTMKGNSSEQNEDTRRQCHTFHIVNFVWGIHAHKKPSFIAVHSWALLDVLKKSVG